MKTERIITFDYLKGIAIFLVVWCHCIQYIAGNSFNNTFYSIIYSFHMPLFIIISGYLFSRKMDKTIISLITKQFSRLIIPNIVWGGVAISVLSLTTYTTLSLRDIIKLPTFCWFLSSLFVSSIIYVIIYKIGIKNYVAATILLSLGFLLIPGCEFIKFFIPFFGIGLILARTNIMRYVLKWKYIIIGGGLIVILYSLLWSREFYVYCIQNPVYTEFSLPKWSAYFARIIFGSMISIWLMIFVRKIEKKVKYGNVLFNLSRNSLGIYVIHYSLFYVGDAYLSLYVKLSETSVVALMCVVSVVIILFINLMIHYLRINKITRLLFLGENNNRYIFVK